MYHNVIFKMLLQFFKYSNFCRSYAIFGKKLDLYHARHGHGPAVLPDLNLCLSLLTCPFANTLSLSESPEVSFNLKQSPNHLLDCSTGSDTPSVPPHEVTPEVNPHHMNSCHPPGQPMRAYHFSVYIRM